MKRKTIENVLKGLIFSYATTGILILLMAMGLWKFNISDKLISIGIMVTYILSSMIGGIYIGRKQKEKKFLWGMCMGMLYVVILCILSGMFGGMVA